MSETEQLIEITRKDLHFLPNCRTDLEKIDELAESIKQNGLLNPISVTENGGDGRYNMLAGHRRLAAWEKVHPKKPIPAIVKPHHEFVEHLMKNLIENMHREGVHDADKAKRICELLEGTIEVDGENGFETREFDKHDKKELAKRLKISQSHLNNLQRCYKQLAPRVFDWWRKNEGKTTLVTGWAALEHDEQIEALSVYLDEQKSEEKAKKTRKKKDDDGETEGYAGKASARELQEVLAKCMSDLEEGQKGVQKAYIEGKVAGLKFALGAHGVPHAKKNNYQG